VAVSIPREAGFSDFSACGATKDVAGRGNDDGSISFVAHLRGVAHPVGGYRIEKNEHRIDVYRVERT
jgi:hypothetical protein